MKYRTELKIEPVEGGWILTYPSFEAFNTNVLVDREIFMSMPKLKKKIAEVLSTIEKFEKSVDV